MPKLADDARFNRFHAKVLLWCLLILIIDGYDIAVMGIALPIICGLFLAYGLLGQYLPGDLAHRGYAIDQMVNQLAFGTEGLYGTPTYVSATYIFLFILFGSFLEQAGMIKLFTDFAMGLFGHKLGGPAKVSVVSSALMGTITGSGVANVVTTGQFTIPLMKRFGYRAAFAGGVEASMGSQMMPPVMGAVAFIMAETINVPFVEVAKAALIPALGGLHVDGVRIGAAALVLSILPPVSALGLAADVAGAMGRTGAKADFFRLQRHIAGNGKRYRRRHRRRHRRNFGGRRAHPGDRFSGSR